MSMAIFNGYVTNYQRVNIWWISHWENKHSLALGYQISSAGLDMFGLQNGNKTEDVKQLIWFVGSSFNPSQQYVLSENHPKHNWKKLNITYL